MKTGFAKTEQVRIVDLKSENSADNHIATAKIAVLIQLFSKKQHSVSLRYYKKEAHLAFSTMLDFTQWYI
jgi:hypothetical protein